MDCIIPIRCKTCNFVIGRPYFFREFWKMTNRGVPSKKIFEKIKIKRICCRQIILTHVEPFFIDL
jgi:DNA-directed RNA polymerase subunit N (RpoN/RPB10)